MDYKNSTQTELGDDTSQTTWGKTSESASKKGTITTKESVTTVNTVQPSTTDNNSNITTEPSETWTDDITEFTSIKSIFKSEHSLEIITRPVETWTAQIDSHVAIHTLLNTVEISTQTENTQNNNRSIEPISNHARKYSELDEETNTPTQNNHQINNEHTRKRSVDNNLIHETCPECDEEIIQENTEQYCGSCGVLLTQENIDPGPEWRAFNHSEQQSKSRVGEPISKTIHDKGLSTVIGNDNKDAKGGRLSNKKQTRMKRLRKWDKRFKVKDTQERNMRQAFGEIQRLASEMELPDYVEETACTIYRKALEEELLPGRSIESMTSASVYIAMRQASIPKTLESLLQYCRVSDSRVTGAYSYISQELGIEIEPPQVSEHLSRISSELSVSKETERKAKELLDMSVDENIHSGKDPSGMAASAVYAATMITRNDRVTQKDACEAGDVCELTIRNRNRELLNMYGVDYSNTSPPSKEEVKN